MQNPITNSNIILGVTGSIAAYKAADLASKLTQQGAMVEVILTSSACKFISPLTFQSVTGRKAYTDEDLWGGYGHVTHVGLGHAANLMVVAPASANTLAKMANGIGDNLLSVTALAASCPIIVAPAMDAGMYQNPATQANVEILKNRGFIFVGPGEGHLASGLVGLGRLVDTPEIIGTIRLTLGKKCILKGRKIIVTAGGTQEPIDPVRFISNRSSGKQGLAIAQATIDAGADVTLIIANPQQAAPIGCREIKVTTASEMLQAVLSETEQADVLIMSAAVADFTPKEIADHKIKKENSIPEIQLKRTGDILAEVAKRKSITGYPLRVIGFAAETENLLQNAKTKLRNKKLDLIVANDVTSPDAGFEVETNRVTLLFADGRKLELTLMNKVEVAWEIIDQVIDWFKSTTTS
jgi:phosphopantothenoylcysteine decarboxylase / phosphopantothenate---cysteine ligase